MEHKFTEERRKLYAELLQTQNNGKFLALLTSNSATTNIKKMEAWKSFTIAFNATAGTEFSKKQVQDFYSRVQKKLRKSTDEKSERAVVNAIRKMAFRTGGGPPEHVNVPGK